MDDFILDLFWIEFDPKVEEQSLLPPDSLSKHLLLHVEPALVVIDVRKLETKIPFLADPRGLENIVKQFTAQSCLFDPEL